MIHKKFRYILTLVALFALTAGAWAQETATITLKCGTTEKTYENVPLPWSTTADILKEVISDYKNVASNIDAITGGDGKVVKYGNEQFTVNGTFSGEATVVVSWYNSSKQYATITVTAPGPLMTLNEAKTEATMESMPAFDATVDYEIVRDMAVSMTTKVGDGDDGAEYRIRVKKNEQGDGYVPAEMDVQQVIALFKVHDGIENKDLTFYGAEAVCALSIYAADDNDQPTGNAISFANLEPGRYVAVATAADGSAYDGSTAASNVLVLFEGYPVEVAAKEYITYYKEENLKLDTEETDAKIYTITDVNGAEATATQLAIAPMNVPILVYNSSDKTKTVLLIPTDDQADDVTAYLGFVGTLEATTIAKSTNSQNNYALNGKEFIWVRTAIPVAANKAWLEVPVSSGNNANIRIVFDNDETTEIEGVDSEQLAVDSDDSWYDLQGRKLDGQPTTKGVYIYNGKKVVVR